MLSNSIPLTLTSTGNSIYLSELYWEIQIWKQSFETPRKSIYIIPGNLGSKFARDKKAKNGNAIVIYLATARAWQSLFLRRGDDRCRCIF